jgi:hypothetical protein
MAFEAKSSQSANYAKFDVTLSYPFPRVIASLSSITDTFTVTGYAYCNDFKVRLMALTDLAKDLPRWPSTNYGRDKLWLVGCLGSEPRLAQSQTGGMRLLSGA